MTLATAPFWLRSVYSSISVPSGSLPNGFISTFCAPSGEFASPRRPAGVAISARNPNARSFERSAVLRFIVGASSEATKGYYGSAPEVRAPAGLPFFLLPCLPTGRESGGTHPSGPPERNLAPARFVRRVSFGMRFAPFPGAAHNAFQVRKPGLPAQFLFDFLRARHQHRGIAGAAWRLLGGNRLSGYPTHRLDDLTHAETLPVTEVVDETVFFLERFQDEKVGSGEVAHVNVVADAGAVRRRIVGSENGELRPLAEGYLERQRNQVRFRMVILALIVGRASHVEIAQRGVAQTVNAMEPFQHLLYQQFGFAVGVGRLERSRFLNGRFFRGAVKRGRRGKDKAGNFVGEHCLQQSQRVGGVVAEVFLRQPHGLAGFDEGREVHHRQRVHSGKRAVERGAVADITNDQLDARRQSGAMPVRKIVVNHRLIAVCQQLSDDHASDITRTTRNQDALPHEFAGLSCL